MLKRVFQDANKDEEPTEGNNFVEDAADIDARNDAVRREQGVISHSITLAINSVLDYIQTTYNDILVFLSYNIM